LLEQLIVVDYQEGAGGEFLANWLSAHFGQKLNYDQQTDPNYLQKWLNSHSLIKDDWRKNFNNYLLSFNKECNKHHVYRIAVPYHLYKYPEHVDIIKKINQARFVRINCTGYEAHVNNDFQRKIIDRLLGPKDFAVVKFLLTNKSQEHVNYCLELFKNKKLTYGKLLSVHYPSGIKKHTPSDDVEIMYEDFFINFDRTSAAYQTLCNQLQLSPNPQLLDALIDRNKKNLQHLQII